MSSPELSQDYLSHFFQELGIERPVVVDLDSLGGERFWRGYEGAGKFCNIDISALGLGQARGFVHADPGDGAEIRRRYEKWLLLKRDGFSESTFHLCVPVVVQGQDVGTRLGLLSEDLVSRDSDIIELFSFRAGMDSDLTREAASWLSQFMRNLNRGNIHENIMSIPHASLREALQRQYDQYVVGRGKGSVPKWDPFIEEEAIDVLNRLEMSGWSATGDNLFLHISRTHQDWWPYRRELIIGDLGLGLSKGPQARVERGEIYDLIQYSYFVG